MARPLKKNRTPVDAMERAQAKTGAILGFIPGTVESRYNASLYNAGLDIRDSRYNETRLYKENLGSYFQFYLHKVG